MRALYLNNIIIFTCVALKFKKKKSVCYNFHLQFSSNKRIYILTTNKYLELVIALAISTPLRDFKKLYWKKKQFFFSILSLLLYYSFSHFIIL